MQWFKNLKIFWKIFVLSFILLIFIIGQGLNSLISLNGLNKRTDDMYHNQFISIIQLETALSSILANDVALKTHIDSTDPEVMNQLQQEMQMQRENQDKALSIYKSTNLCDEEKSLFSQLEKAINEYRSLYDEIFDLSIQGKKDEAAELDLQAEQKRQELYSVLNKSVELNKKSAEENDADNDKILHATIVQSIIITIIATLIGFLLTIFIARIIKKPIVLLEQAAKKIATGDLSIQWDVKSQDEIGSLSQSILLIVEKLNNLIGKVQDDAYQVASSAEELSASAQQNSQAIMQITETSQEVAHGVQGTAENVESILQDIEQSSTHVQQISATTQQVASVSSDVAKHAREGNETMDKADEEMQNIITATNNISNIIQELGDRSNTIVQIVDLISGIADQTNLLALNAAIEAARAGEQGKGFAVVAEEIRKLAEQSNEATQEIATLISQIQVDTDKAVQTMENSIEIVQRGNDVVKKGTDAFRIIEDAIEKVVKQFQEVSKATEKMAERSAAINSSIQIIGSESNQANENIQSIAASTEEQTASMEEITASTENLAELAEDLQLAISEFKL